jgi:hypothetical protein
MEKNKLVETSVSIEGSRKDFVQTLSYNEIYSSGIVNVIEEVARGIFLRTRVKTYLGPAEHGGVKTRVADPSELIREISGHVSALPQKFVMAGVYRDGQKLVQYLRSAMDSCGFKIAVAIKIKAEFGKDASVNVVVVEKIDKHRGLVFQQDGYKSEEDFELAVNVARSIDCLFSKKPRLVKQDPLAELINDDDCTLEQVAEIRYEKE